MKIIILAAGIGSRLNAADDHLPKSLTQLENGVSILQYQLDTLASVFSLEDVFIVVGYKKEVVLDRFPNFAYIFNPNFAEENTSKSLLRALNKVNEDVLWLNGDVLFHPSVLHKILETNLSVLVVNEAAVGEEEVKYRTDKHGLIVELSKQVNHPQGEALGINFFKQQDLSILKQELERCKPSDYFEKAIEEGIKKGLRVGNISIDLNECVEIDFPEDLIKANQILKSWYS